MATPTTRSSSPTQALVRYEGLGLDRARGWVEMPRDERRRRAMAAAQTQDVPALLSLAESWLLLYGRRKKQTSPLTVSAYRQGIMALVEAWRGTDLLKADSDAASLWLESLTGRDGKKDAAASTRVRYRAAGRALYSALRWANATSANPFADANIAPDSTPAHEKRAPYTPADVARLVAVATGDDLALALLGAHAGLRVAEGLALRYQDIDIAASTLTVTAGKGGKRRTVTMSPSLARALDDLGDTGERVVGERSGYVLPYGSAVSARRRLALLCARAGVTYRGIHALRHSAGTRLYSQTGRLEDAQRHLGHASISTTQVYAHWSDERVKTALTSW